jgi:predicted transcriptional regulator
MANTYKRSKVYYAVEDILGSYIPIQEEIEHCKGRIEKIRFDMDNSGYSAIAYDSVRVQTSKLHNSVEDSVIKNVGKLVKLEEQINSLRDLQSLIEQFIECLKDVRDQDQQDQFEAIRLFYVEGKKMIDIAEEWGRDSRIVRRKKSKAIHNLIVVYNKRGKEFGFR